MRLQGRKGALGEGCGHAGESGGGGGWEVEVRDPTVEEGDEVRGRVRGEEDVLVTVQAPVSLLVLRADIYNAQAGAVAEKVKERSHFTHLQQRKPRMAPDILPQQPHHQPLQQRIVPQCIATPPARVRIHERPRLPQLHRLRCRASLPPPRPQPTLHCVFERGGERVPSVGGTVAREEGGRGAKRYAEGGDIADAGVGLGGDEVVF